MSRGLRKAQRDAYLFSRALGDLAAAQRGSDVLARRLVKRSIHRREVGLLRRWRLW